MADFKATHLASAALAGLLVAALGGAAQAAPANDMQPDQSMRMHHKQMHSQRMTRNHMSRYERDRRQMASYNGQRQQMYNRQSGQNMHAYRGTRDSYGRRDAYGNAAYSRDPNMNGRAAYAATAAASETYRNPTYEGQNGFRAYNTTAYNSSPDIAYQYNRPERGGFFDNGYANNYNNGYVDGYYVGGSPEYSSYYNGDPAMPVANAVGGALNLATLGLIGNSSPTPYYGQSYNYPSGASYYDGSYYGPHW